jgi:hypothetical protein
MVAEIAGLPAVVFRCIQYLEAKNADEEEGIYRLSGSSAMVKTLKDRFNTGLSAFCILSCVLADGLPRGRRGSACCRRLLGPACHRRAAQELLA